jgi:hypothetical protein
MLHHADSSLPQAEREEREVQRLRPLKKPRSRKYKPRREPRRDLRRRRMKVQDSDLGGRDKDLSLNRKDVGSYLADIALVVAVDAAASNGAGVTETMLLKTATYHGVIHQGHPSGPTNTGYQSIDKRYFNKDHHESILIAAKEYLAMDWLKYNWDQVDTDAQSRAALDLAIQTANDGLFQSKIDAGTYEMLLARLTGTDEGLFSNTYIGKVKKAAAMNSYVQNIVQVANDLRQKEPLASFRLLCNVTKLAQNQHHGQQQNQAIGPKFNPKEVKRQLGELMKVRDQEDLVEAIGKLQETFHSASRVAAEADLSVLEVLTDTEVKELIRSVEPDVRKFERGLDDVLGSEEYATRSLNPDELQQLLQGFDAMIDEFVQAAKQKKTACVQVNIAALVRLAANVPESQQYIREALILAKKKVDRTRQKKVSQQDDDQEKVTKKPSGGKKTPSFLKGKGKKNDQEKGKSKSPKGKGKKASVHIAMADVTW